MEANLLLNAIALGSMTSSEIGLLIQATSLEEYEKLSQVLCGVKIPNDLSKATIDRILTHQAEMNRQCGRKISLKAAALDYMEHKNIDIVPGVMSISELSRMALHDELTGAANFRYFSMKLKDEVCRAKRYKHVMSLIMADLDHFKSINDKHGHEFGNQALKFFVSIINSCIRETDFVARYGGEEFAILLPETNKTEALVIAERIRTTLEVKRCKKYKLAASFGISSFGRDTFEQDQLVPQADEALYSAKNTGRNKTVLFTGSEKYNSASVTFGLTSPSEKVYLVGSFNNWDPTADEMHRYEHSELGRSFTTTLILPPGTYQYKYVADGVWKEEPSGRKTSEDGYGGKNSVVTVIDSNSIA